MRQHDVFVNPIARLRDQRPYLVLLQADALAIATRHVVGPLLKIGAVREALRLTPRITLEGRDFVFYPLDIASLPIGALGKPVGNLADQRDKFRAATDMLFNGV